MRDVYTVLATMVAHDRISMSNVTQVQAEKIKSHQFTNSVNTCREMKSSINSVSSHNMICNILKP